MKTEGKKVELTIDQVEMICDKYCRMPYQAGNQEQLEDICLYCPINGGMGPAEEGCPELPESEISLKIENESEMDLINRRDAVNAIEEVWCKWDVNTIDRFRDELQERFVALPSAQPNMQPNLQLTCNLASNDCISRQDAIDAIGILLEQSEDDEHDKIWNNAIRGSINAVKHHLPSAQPTLYGYDIKHLMLIADVLRKENLSPERVTEALTDIGRIVSTVRDEFEEALRKSVEQCKI